MNGADLKEGGAHALDRLYREHARGVFHWVIRLGGPWLDAQDVAHDVFVVALQRVHTIRDDAPVGPWLYGVTRRVVANARRRAAFRRFVGLEDRVVPDPSTDGSALWRHLYERHRVQSLLEQLSSDHREVIVLADLEERTAPEIALMIQVSVGTVYSRLHHARRHLKAILEKESGVANPTAAQVETALRGAL